MQHHTSGIITDIRLTRAYLLLVANALGSKVFGLEEKPPTTNQTIVAVAAVGTFGLARLIQLLRSRYCRIGP